MERKSHVILLAILAGFSFHFYFDDFEDSVDLSFSLFLPLLIGHLYLLNGVNVFGVLILLFPFVVFNWWVTIYESTTVGYGINPVAYALSFLVPCILRGDRTASQFIGLGRKTALFFFIPLLIILSFANLYNAKSIALDSDYKIIFNEYDFFDDYQYPENPLEQLDEIGSVWIEYGIVLVLVILFFLIRWKKVAAQIVDFLSENETALKRGIVLLILIPIFFLQFLSTDISMFQIFDGIDIGVAIVAISLHHIAFVFLFGVVFLFRARAPYVIGMITVVFVCQVLLRHFSIIPQGEETVFHYFDRESLYFFVTGLSAVILGKKFSVIFADDSEVEKYPGPFSLLTVVGLLLLGLPPSLYHFDYATILILGGVAFLIGFRWKMRGVLAFPFGVQLLNVFSHALFFQGEYEDLMPADFRGTELVFYIFVFSFFGYLSIRFFRLRQLQSRT